MKPRILLLGGLDPCGGAGLTADATVVALHGGLALPIAMTLTEQNRFGFRCRHAVAAPVWHGALDCALADGAVHAVKVGLLAGPEQLAALAVVLAPLARRVPIVVDPVLSATAGGLEVTAAHAAAYLQHLVPLCAVFTPNLPELAAICAGDAARALQRGARAVLVKGGHEGGPFAEDVLWQAEGNITWRRPRLAVGRVHGTGCALATAVASGLARGWSIAAATEHAGDWLAVRLRALGPADADGLPRPLPLHLGSDQASP